jgi:DNA-binding IclR family transcriptional regulator
VSQTIERRYVLGPRIFELAQARAQRADLRRLAQPAMRRLAAELGETVLLGRVEADGVRIVERTEAPLEHAELRIAAPAGLRIHLLAGATGRLIVSAWPAPRRAAFAHDGPLPRFTSHSIVESEAFLFAAEEAARAGYGVDREEYLDGVNAVAAPIYAPGRELVALLWAVGHSARFNGSALDQAGKRLRSEADVLSRTISIGARADAVPARPQRASETTSQTATQIGARTEPGSMR